MRTEHKLLFELLQCTGIQYGLNNRGIIEASDWWWEQKLKENPKYEKFKDYDNKEIYHTYIKLFGASKDSTKYALTSTKLLQCGLDLSSNSNEEDGNDTKPITQRQWTLVTGLRRAD
ncbi:Hypothetical predicted protein [Olea europaea subsp. europaea]|uniref:Uncharacterized protein n=1 Tax=Olea europaea subsp. europaea TaxID=158383 RepID=A0A8S0QGM2_OLEEU|nr:Hypothetical predicted protein [Olea europaea subsp. europaea]